MVKKFICFIWLPVFLLLFPAMSMAQVHTVSKGESIFRICSMYNVNQYALRYNNYLWTDMLNQGQQLNIPDRYTVKQGDSLNLIGKKFGTDVNSIKGINQLKNDTIYPGQILHMPSKSNSNTNTYSEPGIQIASRGGARLSMTDFDLLARIITAEADSESYATQVAVGATVLNRVDSSLFPNTIPGVVYQVDQAGRYQFEPVLNGWINNSASESGKKAARDALNGWDPTNGALYFFESWVPNKFLQSRPVSKVMDAFTFSF